MKTYYFICIVTLVNKPKMIIVVGPTASGKTGLAIELAQRFNGEVVSADSRQVYRGLDIGSAKVTEGEMDGVPHHLLDVADPMDVYTAADWKRDAAAAIGGILKRGRLPIIAGGTFFYIDALLNRVTLPEVPPNQALRTELETKNAAELVAILEELDPERAATVERDNPRRLIRAIEIAKALGRVPPPVAADSPYDTLLIGLTVDMQTHGEVIRKRLTDRFEAGMVDEVEGLLNQGVTHERLENLGLEYRYVSRYLRGLMSYEAMVDELATKSRQFARRQMTWLKRDRSIHWFQRHDPTIVIAVEQFLQSD